MINNDVCYKSVLFYGKDILNSPKVISQKNYIQHRDCSVYKHSLNVAILSVGIADKLKLNVDYKSLVRGALLHDYFLYDWHKKEHWHRLHGYKHARFAFLNACSDFQLSEIEKDIISKHMFPLNIKPPKYRESKIVWLADKVCAFLETINYKFSFNDKKINLT